MGRDIRQIVADIDSITSLDDGDVLDRLSDLCDECFASPDAAAGIDAWFRVYERFPGEHGNGVFWSVLHGLEAQPTSGTAAVASVARRPTHYPVLMVSRMLNAGIPAAAGVDLLGLLRAVAGDERNAPDVRDDALRYLRHHAQSDGPLGAP